MAFKTAEEYLEIIQSNQYKLLGEIDVSDEEYEHLNEYFKNRIIKSSVQSTNADIKISLFLVNVAVREFEDGKYWNMLSEILGVKLTQQNMSRAKDIFIKTIRKYDLFELPATDNRTSYLENIKTHAFVTNHYMNGFYDFANSYFDTVLFRQLDRTDYENDIDDLKEYMRYSLEKGDTISVDMPGKVSKSYRLLKSTKSFFAYADKKVVSKMFYPVLKMIDGFFYDDEIPSENSENRFERGFFWWCEEQKKTQDTSERKRLSRIINRNPYLTLDNNIAELVIPAQKFRTSECEGFAYAVIGLWNDENEDYDYEKVSLDIYQSFGIYISDEKIIPLPSPFEETVIEIYGKDDVKIRTFRINGSSHRTLDSHYRVISKLKEGINYIILLGEREINANEFVKVDEPFTLCGYTCYPVICNDGAIIKIGYINLRYTTGDYCDADYESITDFDMTFRKCFYITDSSGRKLTTTNQHPVISFSANKEKYMGIALDVNGYRWTLKEIQDEHPSAVAIDNSSADSRKVHISVHLEKLYYSAIGHYKVYIDVPGEESKVFAAEYFCVGDSITVRRNRSVYEFGNSIKITLTSDKLDSINFASLFEADEIKNEEDEYHVSQIYETSYSNIESADFSFMLDGDEYRLCIPVPKFEFGGSVQDLAYRNSLLWYSDIPDNLYISMPGAYELFIKCAHNEREYLYKGEQIADSIFKVEIAELNGVIKECSDRSHFILKIMYNNGKIHRKNLMVQRQLKVEPYFRYDRIEEDYIINIESIEGKGKLYVDIENIATKEIVIEKQEITIGENRLYGLHADKDYMIYPYILEMSLFSSVRTSMKSRKIYGIKDYSDISKYYVNVLDFYYNDKTLFLPNYKYGFDHVEKISTNTYSCRMYAFEKISDGKFDYHNKKVIGMAVLDVISDGSRTPFARLYMVDNDDGEYVEPYYDKNRRMIISPNNKYLLSKNYNDYVPLYEDETVVKLSLIEKKEYSNDIQTNGKLEEYC